MVDAHGLGPCGETHGGSSPLLGTMAGKEVLSQAEEARAQKQFADYCLVFGYGENGADLPPGEILDVIVGEDGFADVVNQVAPNTLVSQLQIPLHGQPPARTQLRVHEFLEAISYPPGTFVETVSFKGLWQISEGGISVLTAMREVTAPGGRIKIFPVCYGVRPEQISLPAQVTLPYDEAKDGENTLLSDKTLQITNDPSISPERWERIFAQLWKDFIISGE